MLKLLLGDPNARKLSATSRCFRHQSAGGGNRSSQRRRITRQNDCFQSGLPTRAAWTTSAQSWMRSCPKLCGGAGSGQARAWHAPFRRSVDRRHGAARGPDRRNENRRGQDPVATLPSYLNALTGRGVHVVTVNDYLARRDAEWMGQVHAS